MLDSNTEEKVDAIYDIIVAKESITSLQITKAVTVEDADKLIDEFRRLPNIRTLGKLLMMRISGSQFLLVGQ